MASSPSTVAAERIRSLTHHLRGPAPLSPLAVSLDQSAPLRVCVTGAAGQIAYSLLFSLGTGLVFGPTQRIVLHLLDIPAAMDALNGVVMELEDCALPLVAGIVATADPLVAFDNVDWAIMLGAMPRREGMLRKDLLKANVGIFKAQGEALDRVAKKSVRVVVVGNPANTNALVCSHYAPSIPARNFSALTRLDENRARSMIANRVGVAVDRVKNVAVWGNHSNTQFPCTDHGSVLLANGTTASIDAAVNDPEFLRTTYIKNVSLRGSAIIAARKLSSAMSAAKAVCDHVRDWHFGTAPGEFVSMAIMSDGSYGIPRDLMFSFPVTVANGEWTIVPDLPLNDFARTKLAATTAELEEEKFEALAHIHADAAAAAAANGQQPPTAARPEVAAH
ncbi:Malate dehydrogenase, cytoplasmic [Blastocladiella emersonii ATCC 22665]|nr:Malate dehydrogenase, cytoplasmic [Blastocladiella emersonii ATCC 22665]